MPEHPESQRVAILGASANPTRYSHQAVLRLREHGHVPLPIHPSLNEIEGIPVVPSLAALDPPVTTLSVYVNPAISSTLADQISALRPQRVIFNPGSENPELQKQLEAQGIEVLEACTLVMLSTGQF